MFNFKKWKKLEFLIDEHFNQLLNLLFWLMVAPHFWLWTTTERIITQCDTVSCPAQLNYPEHFTLEKAACVGVDSLRVCTHCLGSSCRGPWPLQPSLSTHPLLLLASSSPPYCPPTGWWRLSDVWNSRKQQIRVTNNISDPPQPSLNDYFFPIRELYMNL